MPSNSHRTGFALKFKDAKYLPPKFATKFTDAKFAS